MLIRCDKHTKEDLALWDEYEEAFDAPRAATQALSLAEERACHEIEQFAKSGNCYISVSWGKDSVVVADLAMRNGINLPIVSLRCVPSHNPYCDAVRDSILSIYDNAYYDEIIVDYGDIYSRGLTDAEQDKETDKLFFAGFKEASRKYGDRHVSGIRQYESAIRNLRVRRFGLSTEHACAPIGRWSTEAVFAYLYKYNLPVHPNYGMLGGGKWDRHRIRVAEIGDIHGNGIGRAEWENEYYQDELRRIKKYKKM